MTASKEGHFWTSELCCFGGTFGSVEAQCGHQREPEEHFERIQEQSTVNLTAELPQGSPTPGGGPRHLSCIRGAQLKAQNTKEISTEMP